MTRYKVPVNVGNLSDSSVVWFEVDAGDIVGAGNAVEVIHNIHRVADASVDYDNIEVVS